MSCFINFNIDDDLWINNKGFLFWKDNLNKIFDSTIFEKYNKNWEVSVNLLLTNNNIIQDLNYRFRKKNEATNVLSFPTYGEITTIQEKQDIILGDIAMAYEKIMQESELFKIKFFDRCSHLFVHGILHLLGMSHQDISHEKEMETLEIKILGNFNIKNPYILIGE